MKSISKFLMCLLLLVFVFTAFETTQVQACSGPIIPLEDAITRTEIIVKAQVIEVDDLSRNGIVHVDTYLKGGAGPEYILIARNTPAMMVGLMEERYGGGDCNIFDPALTPGTTVYMFLERRSTGNYAYSPYYFGSSYFIFPNDSTTLRDYFRAEDGEPEQREITESAFLEYIDEYVNDAPVLPNSNMPYPLKSPLHVTTSNGIDYVLPVDGTAPAILDINEYLYDVYVNDDYIWDIVNEAGCETIDCYVVTPNSIDFGVQIDANNILLSHVIVPGQDFLFSPTSDSVAVWNDSTLEVYGLPYERLFDYRWYDQMRVINSVELNSADVDGDILRSDYTAWSPDGRLLAYSDADGLWLWDIFTLDSDPRLLISTSANNLPYARYFSPMGRYLAVSENSENKTLDLVSGVYLPDGIISPDERTLLAYDTSAELFSFSVCRLTPYNCIGEIDGLVRQLEWIDSREYIAIGCVPNDPTSCAIFEQDYYHWIYYYYPNQPKGYSFDYDPANNALVVLQDDSTILVNGEERDLSQWLDGDIVSIEWLPSLFYRE